MREKLGVICHVAGLALMGLAIVEVARVEAMGKTEEFGNELIVGFAGFLLIFIGRGLRGGKPAT